MLAGFLFLLLLIGGESFERNCSYVEVLEHLNLTKNKDLFFMTRPVKNYMQPTEVYVDVLLFAILDVREKNQQLVTYIWIDMWWKSEPVSWDPNEFCGIEKFSLPAEVLWKPDITILEMTEKDKNPPISYLILHNSSYIELTNNHVVVSACRMRVFKFPFDIQSCNLSFKSVIHSDKEIHLVEYLNSSMITDLSRKLMRTQYEWLFMDITVSHTTVQNFDFNQSVLVYIINMKRRSALYVVNLMLPVLFFLCLDLASFLMSDSGGEKLGFKVTVLLAVTVMQLILNDILPFSSDRIPLIAIYCIGSFGLMMLSLLETILVMHLISKDSQDNEPLEDQSLMSKEGSSRQLMEDFCDSEKLSYELKEVVKKKKEERKPGYWTGITKTINKVYFISYIIVTSVFLVSMSFSWIIAD